MGDAESITVPDNENGDADRSEASTGPQLASAIAGAGSLDGSFWDHKPGWCQPWSILTTGVVIISLSWWLTQRWWISVPLSAVIGMWWWLFLVAVPTAWREQRWADARVNIPGSRPDAPAMSDRLTGDGKDLNKDQT